MSEYRGYFVLKMLMCVCACVRVCMCKRMWVWKDTHTTWIALIHKHFSLYSAQLPMLILFRLNQFSFCQMSEQVYILKCNAFKIVKCKIRSAHIWKHWRSRLSLVNIIAYLCTFSCVPTIPVILPTEAIKTAVKLPWLDLFTDYFNVLLL